MIQQILITESGSEEMHFLQQDIFKSNKKCRRQTVSLHVAGRNVVCKEISCLSRVRSYLIGCHYQVIVMF